MKKFYIIATLLLLGACSEIDYKEEKKVVIRRPKKKIVEEKPNLEVVVPERKKVVKLTLGAGANFDFDRSELKGGDIKRLDKFIEYIKDKDGKLSLEGHTDSRGSNEYNMRLSMRRVRAVEEYMRRYLELDKYDLSIEGKGEEELLVEELTREDMAENRRVEIEFIEY